MSDQQFETLVDLLKSINKNIESIKGSPDSKHQYDLSDIYSEISDVVSAVKSLDKN